MKTAKQLERYFKGSANHHRIEILLLVSKKEQLTLEGISEILGRNMKTMSQHTRSLAHAGLLNKAYQGRSVVHSLSPYGKKFVKFLLTF
ncbi:MAG: helix-turn-helix transcriptional regulator [bacterium]|nr:helix-turn-helix transcriptional regulator [bacterium]